jgi:hypothetical protein
MIFNIKTVVNWDLIRKRKQSQVYFDNQWENKRRVAYDYKVGQRVYLINTDIKHKCQAPHEGPYEITDVFKNGTVHIQKGISNERVNIRCITPHFDWGFLSCFLSSFIEGFNFFSFTFLN